MLASGLFHLVMASVWLILGVAILLADPPGLRLTRFGLDVSVGWFALLLTGYDLARWWSLRSTYKRRRAAEKTEQHRPARRPADTADSERNPDFIFGDPPPPSSA